MSCKKMIVGSVAALVLVTAGFGFGYNAKEETKLDGLLKNLLTVRKEIVTILQEKRKLGQVSMPDVIQAEVEALQAQLELCQTEDERIAVLKQMEVVFENWEKVADHGFKSGALTQEDVLRIKAKRITMQIDVERQRMRAENKK
ncbi:MAG: TolC family protein [Planctomycetales bacterium]